MLNNTNNGPLFLPDTSLTVPQNIIPMVIETSPRGERAFDIYSLLLRERINSSGHLSRTQWQM